MKFNKLIITFTLFLFTLPFFAQQGSFTEKLLLSDRATGFGQNATGGANGEIITVTNRKELLSALKKGSARVIYVKGQIDMTDTGRGTLLPQEVKGSNSRLDAKIAEITKNTALPVKNYGEWKQKYTGSFNYSENESGDVKSARVALNEFWKNLVEFNVLSNTTIVGVDSDSAIIGGALQIKNAENIIIRNLKIFNCYNPFPKIEDNDGLNADLDCIAIKSSKNIWIDHCSISSKFSHDQVASDTYLTKDGEKIKWQVYDGLCDLTNANDYITISWCIFRNHDKTMLIGNSDKNDSDNGHQTITLHHNWFDGCTQRLPMVRFATIHIYNNLYTNTQEKGIDRRKDCHIYSENNVFQDKEKSVTNNTYGTMFDSGSLNIKTAHLSEKPEWIPSQKYTYKADPALNVEQIVKNGAGSSKSFSIK